MSFTYWRASHPLVFISTLLLIGIGIAQNVTPISNEFARIISLSIFTISLITLITISYLKNPHLIGSLLIYTIVMSWGMALSLGMQNHISFTIPYPSEMVIHARNWVIHKINKTIMDKEANGFALAILIGMKMDMNPSLVSAYTQLGIIHIVAISGMHLEILFKNLQRVTRLLPRQKMFLWLELFILLGIVWIYTLMAFASPSIVRASVFFSIYTIGKFIGGKSYMLNTIAGGLLILILLDSKDLHHIGLQLSYAAVIGIHLFYKLLYRTIELNNPLIQFLWSNCCMSISAQLTTFPILALHFHQIAGWILVSNFIMVPLSNFILYALGILLLMPMQFNWAIIWGQLTASFIVFFNHFVQNWFVHTKAQSIQIAMAPSQIGCYYLILLFGYLWLLLKKTVWLLAILGTFCAYNLLKLFSYN